MSYEKLYSKQFVKLDEDWIIPMILSGSSNCTMYYGGREIGERSWFHFVPSCDNHIDSLTMKINDIRDYYNNMTKEGTPESEWFKDMNSGNWITNATFMKWFDNGIKSARTIEEVKIVIPGQSIYCYVTSYHNTEFKSVQNKCTYCNSTEELKNWIYSLKDYKAPENYDKTYVNIGWTGIEPLHLGKKVEVKDNIPVVCKVKRNYIYAYTDTSLSYTQDKSKAIVFDNKEDFENKLLPVLHHFYSTKWTLVSAETLQKKETPKAFAIYVKQGTYAGAYILKKAKYSVYFSGKNDAKKFSTQKSAESWIEDKLYGFIKNKGYEFEVVNVGEE